MVLLTGLRKKEAAKLKIEKLSALVIVQPTKCGVRRLVAAFGTTRRRVAALHKLTHRAERWTKAKISSTTIRPIK